MVCHAMVLNAIRFEQNNSFTVKCLELFSGWVYLQSFRKLEEMRANQYQF